MPLDDAAVAVPDAEPQATVQLDYIEEVLQKCDNEEVEAIIGDLGFVLDRYIQQTNTEIKKVMGPDWWLTASIDMTVVHVEPVGEEAEVGR